MANKIVTYPADVGVLVVHGIGNQTKGSTMRGVVDPLLDHLTAQLAPETTDAKPTLRPVKCSDDQPTTIIDVPQAGDLGPQTWLVREAHWAEVFDPPTRSETARWLASVGPWFVFFFIARLWRRFGVEWQRAALGLLVAFGVVSAFIGARDDDTAMALIGLVAAAAIGVISLWVGPPPRPRIGGLVVAGTVIVFYPVAAVMTVGVVALAVLGMLPLPGAKTIRKLQTALAGTIGDAYALVSTPRRERAMRDVIKCAIEGLCAVIGQPDGSAAPTPIVLLCHSQGAALTYRLLRQEWPQELDDRRVTLVTYGSAIVPIHVLEYRFRDTGARVWSGVAAAIGLLSLLGLTLLLLRAATLGGSRWWLWLAAGIGLAAATVSGLRDAVCLDGGAILPPDHKSLTETKSAAEEAASETSVVEGYVSRESSAGPETASSTHRESSRVDYVRALEQEVAKTRRRSVEPNTLESVEKKKDGRGRDARCPKELFIPGLAAPNRNLRWVDLWAPWDPVPNGPLVLSKPEAIPPAGGGRTHRTLQPTWPTDAVVLPESYLVSNDHQPWFDHVTYRTNTEDVVGRFALEVAAAAEAPTVGLSFFEHRWDTPPDPLTDGLQLRNPVANKARQDREHRGWWMLGGQLAALVTAVIAATMRREQIGRLGDWAEATFPSPLRSGLSGLIDLVPQPVRDFLAGGVRDPGHGYGLLLVIGIVALVLGAIFAAMRSAQGRATHLFGRGADTPWFSTPLAKAAVLLLVIGPLVLVLWQVPEREAPTSTRIEVAVDGTPAAGTVTLQPLGLEEDRAVVVDVPAKGKAVRINDGHPIVVTAEVPGAKECDAVFDKDVIKVSCHAKATPIEIGSG